MKVSITVRYHFTHTRMMISKERTDNKCLKLQGQKLEPSYTASESHSVVSASLGPRGLYSPRNSRGQNTGVGSLSLLQGIFPIQGSNPGLPHCRQILYQLSHKGSPKTLKWVAYPFSSGSSRPRNPTRVSCIAGGFFTTEPQGKPKNTEWVAYPFSSGSSRPRNRTRVSCIAGGFFTNWAITVAQL